MCDEHLECSEYTSNILRDLIAQIDEEALEVVAEAAEERIAGIRLLVHFFILEYKATFEQLEGCT